MSGYEIPILVCSGFVIGAIFGAIATRHNDKYRWNAIKRSLDKAYRTCAVITRENKKLRRSNGQLRNR